MSEPKVRCNLEHAFEVAEPKSGVDWKQFVNPKDEKELHGFNVWYTDLDPILEDEKCWSFLIDSISLPGSLLFVIFPLFISHSFEFFLFIKRAPKSESVLPER